MRQCSLQRASGAFVLLCLTLTAAAHRAPGSLTTIEFNAESGMTEIVHWLHLHDAEIGVAQAIDEPSLSLTRLEDRARVALYVEQRFVIAGQDGALPLGTVGAEIFGDHLLVYQELVGRLPAAVLISDDVLRDIFPQQVNTVNIEDYGTVHTLTFAGDDAAKPYRFAPAVDEGEAH